MSTPGRRTPFVRACVDEFRRVYGQQSYWVLWAVHWVLVCAFVLIAVQLPSEDTRGPEGAALGFFLFVFHVFALAFVTTGALEQDRRTGTAELMMLTDLGSRGYVGMVVFTRVVATFMISLTLPPLAMLLAMVHIARVEDAIWISLGTSLVAATGLTAYGIRQLFAGESGKTLAQRITVHFFFPFGKWAIVWFLLGRFTLIAGYRELADLFSVLCTPYISLSSFFIEDAVSPIGASFAMGVCLWLIVTNVRRCDSVMDWLRSTSPLTARHGRQWRPDRADAEGDVDAPRRWKRFRSRAAKALMNLQGIRNLAYRISGRNPYLVPFLTREAGASFLQWAFIIFMVMAAIVGERTGRGPSEPELHVLSVLGLCYIALVIATISRQILPEHGSRGSLDILLATPVRPGTVITGAFFALLIDAWPTFAAMLVLCAMLGFSSGVVSALLLWAAAVSLSFFLGLLSCLLLQDPGHRYPMSLTASGLVILGTGWLLGTEWISQATAGLLIANLVLALGVLLWLRRWKGRMA